MTPRLFRLALLFLLACDEEAGESGEVPVECGDPDGSGTDTGNIPNVAGSWTSSFAAAYWDDNCTAADFDESSEQWIGSFKIEGAYPNYRAAFNNLPDNAFEVAVDARGGLTMTGEVVHEAGTLYANFAGLVYTDISDRDGIDGSAFLGLDVPVVGDVDGVVGDQTIDCYARASWSANKSGL